MALPFTISDVHGGLSEATGALRLDGDYLILEIQVTVAGMFKQKPLTVKITPEAVHSVRYQKGAFRDRLVIRPFKTALLAAVPGKHEGEVTLKVKRVHRDEAFDLIEDLQEWLDPG